MVESDEKIYKEMIKTKGFGWRVSLSIIMAIGWLIFFFIWLFFYITNFSFWQNVAIFIVSILILAGVLGAAWAPWAMRYGDKWDKKK